MTSTRWLRTIPASSLRIRSSSAIARRGPRCAAAPVGHGTYRPWVMGGDIVAARAGCPGGARRGTPLIVSHKHRYVFVELPRTGSTAVRHELRELYDGTPILHKHS